MDQNRGLHWNGLNGTPVSERVVLSLRGKEHPKEKHNRQNGS
jgi:hypothetical protein